MSREGRWAIYYTPPREHPLWHAGCAWLGREPENDQPLPPPTGIDRTEWEETVAAPCRYGFHATLKAPMRLRDGMTDNQLREKLVQLSQQHAPFTLPPLAVEPLGNFLAIRPTRDCPPLRALAAACVIECDDLRAPASESEAARRQAQLLSKRQRVLLHHWGYPHVLEQYRFHLTLTGALHEAQLQRLQPVLAERFAPALATDTPVTDISLWHESEPNAAFRLVERIPLTSAQTAGVRAGHRATREKLSVTRRGRG